MSVLFTCKVRIAGTETEARETFDVYREQDLGALHDDVIVWNMRPAGEPLTYLVDIEADNTDDEQEARAMFAAMIEQSRPVTRGISFSEPEVAEASATPGM